MLIDLTAPSSFSQGYDTGYMLGQSFVENYDNLLVTLLGDQWWEPAVSKLIGVFLDWQWNDYLSVQVPVQYLDELRGMTAGGLAAGLKADVGKIAARGITLANLPGSLENFVYILIDEKNNPPSTNANATHAMSIDDATRLITRLQDGWKGFHCSMFGAWGSRTEGSRLFTGRNLDWLTDSGISKYKLVTVHHPPKGSKTFSHATVGWAGIWGAITGMSSQGLTVHEANLESNDITYRGFPWVLRLREVMSQARTLDQALAVWTATNSTVGFNHAFGSAVDGKAVCLETMKGNSAVFGDNDVREQAEYVVDGQQIGVPRKDAVYRTNHGYDSYTIEHYMWNNTGAFRDSIGRYMAFPEAFDGYEARKTSITHVEAINITSILGSKGDDKYNCVSPYHGSNILSVAFDPSNLIMYTAWENGRGSQEWSPAACNTYLQLNMKSWF